MTEKYQINLSLAINDLYTPYAYVMLHSFFRNHPEETIEVYLLQYDLRDENKANFDRLAQEYGNQIHFLYIDIVRLHERLPRSDRWPVEVYFRLLLLELLPEDVDRILYLDSDIIVNQNIKGFYETDFGENLIIGCRDLALINLSVEECLEKRTNRLRPLFEQQRYINSGVLLLNMAGLRAKYAFEDYMNLAKDLDYQLFSPDQDLINLFHKDEIGYVDSWKYNFLTWIGANNGYTYERAKEEVAILHYAGQGPWKGGNHVHYAMERFWWDEAIRTPYAKDLMQIFVVDVVTDQSILEYIGALENENRQIKEQYGQLAEQNQKLMDELQMAMNVLQKFSNPLEG